MPKAISFRRRVLSVLFWSIISAAFIGPGTVTTAASAGAAFGLQLLWALVFSIVSTILLQEAAARITIASGKNLGEIIALRYARGGHRRLRMLLFLAVALGCGAYEAGNLLGALSGLALFIPLPRLFATALLGILCAVLLWIGNFRLIANFLGLIVAFMGMVFLYVAVHTSVDMQDLIKGALYPLLPSGSALLVIGLIGTTIVPYNLFLASGIGQDQEISEMRWGVALAVIIGGIISVGILVVGTSVSGSFGFEALASALAGRLGSWAIAFFGLGLFAAGMSSAITAPLAAAVTARSLFGAENTGWSVHSRNFRLVWGVILGIGLIFGLLNIQPIPVIILAQAVNGVLLPVVSTFLLLAVNDRRLLPAAYLNSSFTNVLMLLIVGITGFLGLHNIWKAVLRIYPEWSWGGAIWGQLLIAVVFILILGRVVFRRS